MFIMDRKVCRDLVRFIETGNLSDPSYESVIRFL